MTAAMLRLFCEIGATRAPFFHHCVCTTLRIVYRYPQEVLHLCGVGVSSEQRLCGGHVCPMVHHGAPFRPLFVFSCMLMQQTTPI